MAKFNIIAYRSNQNKDGSYPIYLRVTKDGKRIYRFRGNYSIKSMG